MVKVKPNLIVEPFQGLQLLLWMVPSIFQKEDWKKRAHASEPVLQCPRRMLSNLIFSCLALIFRHSKHVLCFEFRLWTESCYLWRYLKSVRTSPPSWTGSRSQRRRSRQEHRYRKHWKTLEARLPGSLQDTEVFSIKQKRYSQRKCAPNDSFAFYGWVTK